MKRALPILGALYVLIGIVTFGHAAASWNKSEEAEYRECLSQNADNCFNQKLGMLSGMMGGMFWPLYWSWEAWS